jgi:hypothetical protein
MDRTEIQKLKGIAKKKIAADKIVRTLNKGAAATKVKVSSLGSLDTRREPSRVPV